MTTFLTYWGFRAYRKNTKLHYRAVFSVALFFFGEAVGHQLVHCFFAENIA
jgi:hypothetical protein